MEGKIDGLFILIAVILVFFGAKKLPELARNVGQSVGELKKGLNGSNDQAQTKSKDSTSDQ